MATARKTKGATMSANDPNAVPGDAPAADATPDPAAPTVEAPVNVIAPEPAADPTLAPDPGAVASNPATDPPVVTTTDAEGNIVETDPVPVGDQASDPTTGEPLTTGDNTAVVPAPDPTPDPAANVVVVPTVVAGPDPSGAASLVIDKQTAPDPVETIPTRSEVAAQQVLDEGTLTPAQPGDAIHPVETLDHHTVDPSGTADDHMPGFASVSAPSAVDTQYSTPEVEAVVPSAKGPGTLDVDSVTLAVTALAEAYAEVGVHKDILTQAVENAYANLQSQRSTAQTAGQPDPFPLLAV